MKYEQEIDEAGRAIDRYRKEIADHLDALPAFDFSEALASMQAIRVACAEIEYYLNRINVLSRLSK